MVVANKTSDFGQLDPHHQQESSSSSNSNTNNGKVNCSDVCDTFTTCDSRGMLKLNQDLIVNKGDIHKLYRIDKGAPFAT